MHSHINDGVSRAHKSLGVIIFNVLFSGVFQVFDTVSGVPGCSDVLCSSVHRITTCQNRRAISFGVIFWNRHTDVTVTTARQRLNIGSISLTLSYGYHFILWLYGSRCTMALEIVCCVTTRSVIYTSGENVRKSFLSSLFYNAFTCVDTSSNSVPDCMMANQQQTGRQFSSSNSIFIFLFIAGL